MPSSLCLSSSGCSSLIKDEHLPVWTVGSLVSYVHTIFAFPQTVSKGSSYLCPLYVLIATVYYEQNYIPELVLHSLRKNICWAQHSHLLGLPLAEVRGMTLLHSVTEVLAQGLGGKSFPQSWLVEKLQNWTWKPAFLTVQTCSIARSKSLPVLLLHSGDMQAIQTSVKRHAGNSQWIKYNQEILKCRLQAKSWYSHHIQNHSQCDKTSLRFNHLKDKGH